MSPQLRLLLVTVAIQALWKKNARISLEEGKARYVVVSARLAWLSSSWSLLTMPRQNTGCHTMLQLTVGPLWLSMSQYCCWVREELRMLDTGDMTVVPPHLHYKKKVLKHFWSPEYLGEVIMNTQVQPQWSRLGHRSPHVVQVSRVVLLGTKVWEPLFSVVELSITLKVYQKLWLKTSP